MKDYKLFPKSKLLLSVLLFMGYINLANAQYLVKSPSSLSTVHENGTGSTAKIGIGIITNEAKFHVYNDNANGAAFKIQAITSNNGFTSSYGSLESFVVKDGQMYGLYQSSVLGNNVLNYFQNSLKIGKVTHYSDGLGNSGLELDRAEQTFTFSLNPNSGPTKFPLIISGNGIRVTSKVTTDEIQLLTGSGSGKVLVSDESGNGIWTDDPKFNDDDWLVSSTIPQLLYSNPKFPNVGVGTSIPIAKFQVNNSWEKVGLGSASGQELRYGTSYIGFNAARTGSNWILCSDGYSNNGGSTIWSGIDGTLYFSTIGTNATPGSDQQLTDAQVRDKIKMTITSVGDIGIGVQNVSGYKLAVKGKILCEELKVQLSEEWPDYVFDKKYKLLSLKDVENYITNNQRLPGVPSAKEVKENGVNLGEMNALFLKKIEEMTQYIIDQQKQIDHLKEKIN